MIVETFKMGAHIYIESESITIEKYNRINRKNI